MHALKFTWKKIISVNFPLFRTNRVKETLDCVKVKRIDSSAGYILMPQSHSAECTALPSSPGLLNSYSQCRWKWPCIFARPG